MELLGRLFPSSQLRDCLYVLAAMTARFDGEIAWDEVSKKAAEALRHENKAVKHRMLVAGDRAKDIVGDIVATICLDDIETGTDHIYRGVLSIAGQSKRNIFAGVITDQIKDGWITLKEAAVANENMKRAVAGAG